MSSNAEDIAKLAKAAFQSSQLIPSTERVIALHAIRAELHARKDAILNANKEDLQVCSVFLMARETYIYTASRPLK